MSEAQETIARVARAGRRSAAAGPAGDSRSATQAGPPHPDDAELRVIMDRYDRLGDEPPRFNIAANDAAHRGHGAHTEERHGPGVVMPRTPSVRTVEGRIYGDPPWDRPENRSYRWSDPSTMSRTINEYVRQNWETIRHDLAFDGRHRGGFDAGHRVGEGYVNSGMFGAGPRVSQYAATSLVKIRIQLVPGSDPPVPFVVTAFPAGLL
ncbi:hypothetical protein [Actinoplanes sp. NPDC026623]|uniref:hypothetical protein n=1 Tax=Actinoplanes sp. NPDC026623 TaxID=3155610 RepID=UPI0033F55F6F